ncbi:S-adenosyl-L-methionine-dependent methyltransferase [Mrakia frigida]|uniref:protein-arginine N5-methyltransferase n=1 Tax=Mrakia frigida TaxID=29902 RepID=UPI003FCC03E1
MSAEASTSQLPTADEEELTQAGTALLNASQKGTSEDVLKLLKEADAPAWYQDELGWTAMHYAAEREDLEMVKVLLKNGGVWNAVDNLGYCPSDIALSLNSSAIYTLLQSHGVRSEFLLSLLSAKSLLMPVDNPNHLVLKDGEADTMAGNTAKFLESKLTYLVDDEGRERVVDEDGNGVMMRWEEGIMRLTVEKLTEGMKGEDGEGLRVLNVGFGLGIIDTMFQNLSPSPLIHTIIEPHPSVLEHMELTGWTTENKPNLRVLKGKWQDWVEEESGAIYEEGGFDVIYFDTFSEGYDELKAFFQHLPNLLAGPESRFSFFHGLGATNATFHDVYTSLSALHLREVGVGSVEWYDLRMEEEVKEEVWKGVRRKYWTLPNYRVPIAKMDML